MRWRTVFWAILTASLFILSVLSITQDRTTAIALGLAYCVGTASGYLGRAIEELS